MGRMEERGVTFHMAVTSTSCLYEDKDALLADFLRETKRRDPQLVDRMHLSLLNRLVAAKPENRIVWMRRFEQSGLFKEALIKSLFLRFSGSLA